LKKFARIPAQKPKVKKATLISKNFREKGDERMEEKPDRATLIKKAKKERKKIFWRAQWEAIRSIWEEKYLIWLAVGFILGCWFMIIYFIW